MKRMLLLCLWPALALAQAVPECEPETDILVTAATGKRIKAALRNKQFAAVEDELNDKLKRYENGAYSDLTLLQELMSAADGDSALEPLLAQWAAEKPRSFFAHLLKGAHHYSVGYKKRGGGFTSATSAAQFAAMKAENVKALPEYKLAMNLRPNSGLVYAGLIQIAAADYGAEAVRGLLAKSIALDPKNMAARRQAISFLTPKWGGSVEDQDDILKQAQRSQLGDKKIRSIQYWIETTKADHFRVVSKELPKAIVAWRKAAQICPSVDPWRRISEIAYGLGDWKTTKEAASHVIAANPNAPLNLARRGWSNEKLGLIDEAIKDYETAADLGDAWAQGQFGTFLMRGQFVPKDWPRARRLLQSAAAKGDATAKTNLDWLNLQMRIK